MKPNQAELATDLHSHSSVNRKHLQDNNIKLRNQTHKTGKGRQVRKIRTKEDWATTRLWRSMEMPDIALSSQEQDQARILGPEKELLTIIVDDAPCKLVSLYTMN